MRSVKASTDSAQGSDTSLFGLLRKAVMSNLNEKFDPEPSVTFHPKIITKKKKKKKREF